MVGGSEEVEVDNATSPVRLVLLMHAWDGIAKVQIFCHLATLLCRKRRQCLLHFIAMRAATVAQSG